MGLKKVYISHPFGNSPERNMEEVNDICRRISFLMPDVVPVSPLNMFSFLNDSNSNERKKALEYCLEILKVCDEVWVFGDWEESEGCRLEVEAAREIGKVICCRVQVDGEKPERSVCVM